jgi:AraC-like DNA-binding protein
VAHECDAVDQVIFSLNIDPETRLGEQLLRTRLNDSKQSACTAEELAYFDCKKIENLIGEEQFEELYHYLQACFGTDLPRGSRLKKDERIEHIKSYISDHLEQRITSAQLCRQVFLSESRLQHLFKAEMGLPIRNYILWLRLTRALKLILKGESLTAAAHEAGFFDSAHMSKTFVRQLGINPAEIVKNSRFVQVSIMEGA